MTRSTSILTSSPNSAFTSRSTSTAPGTSPRYGPHVAVGAGETAGPRLCIVCRLLQLLLDLFIAFGLAAMEVANAITREPEHRDRWQLR